MSKKVTNPFIDQPKKKHPFRVLGITLLIILGVIAIPVGFVAALFLDTSHYDTGVTEGTAPVDMKELVMGNLLDGCRNEEYPTIDITIPENALNVMLLNVVTTLKTNNPQLGQFISQLSFEIYENDYVIGLELSALNFLKTKARIILGIEKDKEVLNYDGEASEGFVFTVKDVKLGRLGGLGSALSGMGLSLKAILSNAGDFASNFHFVFDENNQNSFTYAYDDLATDLMSSMGNSMFATLFKTFFTEKYITFSHTSEGNKVISGTIPLSEFVANDKYSHDKFRLPANDSDSNYLVTMADKVQTMLNSTVFNNVNSDQLGYYANAMHQYLSFGADFIEGDEVTFVKGIVDGSEEFRNTFLGGKTYEEYSDYAKSQFFGVIQSELMDTKLEEVKNVASSLAPTSQIDPTSIETFSKITAELNDEDGRYYIFGEADSNSMMDGPSSPVTITDNELHDLMKGNKQLIGYGFPFVSGSISQYKYSFATLDNIYATTTPASEEDNARLNLSFGLNINGTETSLVLSCPQDTDYVPAEANHFGMRFSVTNGSMYYGNKEMNFLKDILKDLMSDVDKVSDWFIFNKVDGELSAITIDVDAGPLLTGDFKKFHDNMTATVANPGEGIYFPQDSSLFFDFSIVKNNNPDVDGPGRFSINIGYEKNQ